MHLWIVLKDRFSAMCKFSTWVRVHKGIHGLRLLVAPFGQHSQIFHALQLLKPYIRHSFLIRNENDAQGNQGPRYHVHQVLQVIGNVVR